MRNASGLAGNMQATCSVELSQDASHTEEIVVELFICCSLPAMGRLREVNGRACLLMLREVGGRLASARAGDISREIQYNVRERRMLHADRT